MKTVIIGTDVKTIFNNIKGLSGMIIGAKYAEGENIVAVAIDKYNYAERFNEFNEEYVLSEMEVLVGNEEDDEDVLDDLKENGYKLDMDAIENSYDCIILRGFKIIKQ